MSLPDPAGNITYLELLRRNRNLRLLWLGQVVSQLGDWFNAVAVYALLLEVTGSATAVGVMMAVQFVPIALIGPAAGVVVDRFDRVRIMILADLVRGCVIPGLLLVRDADDIWLAYLVVGTSVLATGFFEPARSAIMPRIASQHELLPANSLAAATWSAMLAVGAALGGAVSAAFGRDPAFLINTLSFFLSAALISGVHVGDADRELKDRAAGWRDFVEGVRYVRGDRRLAVLLAIKPTGAVIGGVVLLLTVFGERVFKMAGAGGIGILFAARGLGAGCGAVLSKTIVGTHLARLRGAVGPAFLVMSIGYAALAGSPNIWIAAVAIVAAQAGGAMTWVCSSVLLQTEVPDRLLGRIFAAEFALVTLILSTTSVATALAIDRFDLSPRTLAAGFALFFLGPGLFFSRALARR